MILVIIFIFFLYSFLHLFPSNYIVWINTTNSQTLKIPIKSILELINIINEYKVVLKTFTLTFFVVILTFLILFKEFRKLHAPERLVLFIKFFFHFLSHVFTTCNNFETFKWKLNLFWGLVLTITILDYLLNFFAGLNHGYFGFWLES